MTNLPKTDKGERVRGEILTVALDLFNREGIEYVGVREIAAAMNMRPGNLTYYFASKEDLIFALVQGLRVLNDATLPVAETRTVQDFLLRLEQILNNHVTYRCLLLSMPHLMTQLPQVRDHYHTTTTLRRDDLRQRLRALVKVRALRELDVAEVNYLVSCCSLIARGWLVECVVTGRDPQSQVKHYVALLARMLEPYAITTSPRVARRGTTRTTTRKGKLQT